MTERMKMTRLRVIELDPAVFMKSAAKVIARQLSGSVGELTPSEVKAASLDYVVKYMRDHLDKLGGAAIAGMGFVDNDEGVPAQSLIVRLSNGYALMLPPKAKEHL
ncbi:hypothetical protein AB4Y43_18290 [Paraburkholderia sp. BR10872]|uniref:hypothetical protein n=1 Tax=Paraburkholderia sp. BR10872 TaxID=3236989 RepID=UPI0034D2586E